MNRIIYPTYQELSDTVARRICDIIKEKPDALFCFAAGHSSLGIFDSMVRIINDEAIDVSKLFIVGLDEWLGMNMQSTDSCGDFMKKNLFSRLPFTPDHIRMFDGAAADIPAELQAVEQYITDHNGIDYMLLGMGMNGHLALNEPGVDFNLGAHTGGLDPVTATVGQKYFENAVSLQGGITLGIANIRAAKEIVLTVNGERKADIVARLFSEPISNALPATVLREMDHATIALDAEAASKL